MSIPNNKNELTQAIKVNFDKLKMELNGIPLELSELKTLDGHAKNTLMSVKDLVAYLNWWRQLVLKWNHNNNQNIQVDFPETGFKWNELGLLAQKFYKDYEQFKLSELVSMLEETTKEILLIIENKTNQELYETAWYQEWTLGRMIQLNTSSPFMNATLRIRKWKKTRLMVESQDNLKK